MGTGALDHEHLPDPALILSKRESCRPNGTNQERDPAVEQYDANKKGLKFSKKRRRRQVGTAVEDDDAGEEGDESK